MPRNGSLSWLVMWGGLGFTSAIGFTLLATRPQSAVATDDPHGPGDTSPGIAEARALVKALEARVRSAESDLKSARELLARLENAEKPAPAAPLELTPIEVPDHRLEGVWRIVSIGGNFGDEFHDPPYDEYKIMTAGHYLWLSFDRDTGAVLRSGGGAYQLDGDRYTARVEYSNSSDLRAVAGLEYTGTSRIEGDRCYHYGRMPNGAVFDELWERVH